MMKKVITPSEMRNYLTSEGMIHNPEKSLMKEIHSLEPHTAYILLANHLSPLLKTDSKELYFHSKNSRLGIPNFHSSSNNVSDPDLQKPPMGLWESAQDTRKFENYLSTIHHAYDEISMYTTIGPVERAHITLQQLKNDFSHIKNTLQDLYKKRQEIIDRWIDSTASNPIPPENQLLKDFYYLRETLEKNLHQIRERIDNFEEDMPDSQDKYNLLEKLRTIHGELVLKIPEPNEDYGTDSGNWKPPPNALVDRKGEKTRLRFWWKEKFGDKAKVMKWEDSGNSNLPKNPLGIFEMIIDADRSTYNDYLGTLSRGIDTIRNFYTTTGSRPLHVFLLKNMDTQTAYMYMIVILLPLLQNQSAEALEKQGNTMREVAKLYNKWNEIQYEINKMTEAVKNVEKKGLLHDGKLKIEIIEDFWGDAHYKVAAFDDPDRVFQKIFDARDAIDRKIAEAQKLLKIVKKRLPSSAKTLVVTLDTLLKNLSVTSRDYSFYYYKGTEQVRFEILAKEITLKDNKDYDAMSKFILDRTKEAFGFFVDRDQTKFKTYMDNIGQGITALTSISNMTQQQLQIDTQYYNSLLGFQKAAQDSVNKTIQTSIHNMR